MTIENVNTVSVWVAKAGESFEVDFASLPLNAQAFVITYGLKQLLNDSVASLKIGQGEKEFKTAEDLAEAAADTVSGKIALLVSGEIKARKEGGESVDPMQAEMLRQAKIAMKAALAKRGIKADKETIAAALPAFTAKHNEKLTELAKAELARKAAAKAALANQVFEIDMD